MIEFSQLCGAEKDILCLRYHPLQDLLSEDELLDGNIYIFLNIFLKANLTLQFYIIFSGLNIEFINRVCEVGVDINQCVAHNHMSNMVQFVAGLGPRKGNLVTYYLTNFLGLHASGGSLISFYSLVFSPCRFLANSL